LARRIRAHDSGAQIYLVALTGYGQSEDRLRSPEAGFDDHLVKPVDVNQLALVPPASGSTTIPTRAEREQVSAKSMNWPVRSFHLVPFDPRVT
jgi:CheY-like chemotaxis protein